MKNDNQLVILGETNFRNQRWRFGIKQDDRRRHMYVVGSTGMGKSEFLKNMAIQDIEAGRGIAFLDPHGDPSNDLLDYIPEDRIKDVIYLDPGDLSYPIAFNVMEKVDFEYRHLVASGLLGVFKKIFGVEVWSGRMEYILNNTILALLEYPDATLLGINRMLSNKEYRKKVVDNVKDPIVKSFWVDEFAKYTERFAAEATPAIQNKIGQFISNNLIRNIIGQTSSTIDIRKIMDEGKILIVNLSRGKIGEDASRLLGALLVTKIQLAAMSRVDIAEKDRRDFYLYVDEFQHFATESFANILSEARKFHLSLVVAHQYIKQMEEPVRDAVFGNVGTIISFRVGAEDGEFLEKWFQPDFMMNDIVNLGKFNIYLKLMIDGVSSRGFSAQTIPPFPKLEKSNRENVIEHSRKTYANPRDIVEKNIAEWAGVIGEMPTKFAEAPKWQQAPKKSFSAGGQDFSRPRPPAFERQAPQNYQREERRDYQREERPMRPPIEPPRQYMVDRPPQPPQTNQEPRPTRAINWEPSRPVPIEQKLAPAPSLASTPPPTPTPRAEPQMPNSNPGPYQPQQRSQYINPVSRPTTSSHHQPALVPRAERPEMPQSRQGISMRDAFKQGAVNFRGKRIEERPPKPKVEVNSDELKKVLEEAMGNKD